MQHFQDERRPMILCPDGRHPYSQYSDLWETEQGYGSPWLTIARRATEHLQSARFCGEGLFDRGDPVSMAWPRPQSSRFELLPSFILEKGPISVPVFSSSFPGMPGKRVHPPPVLFPPCAWRRAQPKDVQGQAPSRRQTRQPSFTM